MIHTLSAVNMVDIEPAKFSPLYKIKRLLIILRWLLGFPYKTLNKSFDDFKFVPVLEYFRYGMYLCIFFACQIYINFILMKVYKESNTMTTHHQYLPTSTKAWRSEWQSQLSWVARDCFSSWEKSIQEIIPIIYFNA